MYSLSKHDFNLMKYVFHNNVFLYVNEPLIMIEKVSCFFVLSHQFDHCRKYIEEFLTSQSGSDSF
jgi:hypothetical protein